MPITIRIEKDEVTPHLRKLLAQAEGDGPLAKVLGRAGANVLKKHFRARNKTPNKLGGARTNFWSAVAASVQNPRYSGHDITIAINHPAIVQKVFGGTISAKKTKNLAIPIAPEAHGKSPRVFPHLQFAVMASGAKLLGLKNGAGGINWLYVLKPSVTQSADPHALPPSATMAAELTKAAEIHLRKV